MSVNRQRQRGAAQNSVYTWQTIATEMKALPEQLENRSEDMVQRTAPALIQSLVTKVNGLRDFGADALFGLHDAMESWSSSRLDGFSSPLTEAINARNEAEAQGRPRSGNNCAGQQLCNCPHIVFTQRELDRLGDASLIDVTALELIAMRGERNRHHQRRGRNAALVDGVPRELLLRAQWSLPDLPQNLRRRSPIWAADCQCQDPMLRSEMLSAHD